MAVGLTTALADFVAGLPSRNIPPEAAAIVSLGFTDSVATMIAGKNDPVVAATQTGLDSLKSSGLSRLYFTDATSSAPVAAWINGAAAHAMDYDDVSMLGHPSAVLVPAILAEAEELDLSGKDMVAAYVAGFEVWGELVFREHGSHRNGGWHPTGIFGSLAAASACSVLRKLTPEQTRNALGIAASQSSGLMSNFGSMVKPFHAGHAAFAGVMAARYAAAGMEASEDAIEHPQGFLRAVSETGETDRDAPAEGLGRHWRILERKLSIKRYPLCYGVHRIIDAAVDLADTEDLKADQIERVDAHIGEVQTTMVRHRRPTSALQAKFSVEFAVASSIVARRVGLRELTDDFVNQADIQSLIGRVERVITTDYDPKMENYPYYDFVEVFLKDGRTLESPHVARAKGHADNPITADELWDKFDDCLSDAAAPERRRALFEKLQKIESLPSARALYQ